MLDVHHKLPAAAALTTSYYAAPQEPDDARLLFEAACASAGFDRDLDGPLSASRGAGSSLVLAREWELTDLADRLVDAIEVSFEPTWDRDRGEFTWGMGLNEPHPRGQFNAFLAAAEAAGPGMWTRVATQPIEPGPQVVGVDFPAVALRRARWSDGALDLAVVALDPDPSAATTFRVVGLGSGPWMIEGAADGAIAGSGPEISVTVPLVDAHYRIGPGSGRGT